jgi:aspartate racemase
MKKIGLIGGVSWTSTLDYYRYINEGINQELGGLNSAECIIYSLNFGDIQKVGWQNSYQLLYNASKSLKQSGVEVIVLCANTAHLFAEEIQEKIGLPIINIATETAAAVKKEGINKVGLLGTKFTMEMDFYRNILEENGIEVIIPENQHTRDYIQYIVKEELGKGIITKEAKVQFKNISQELIKKGAEGIILGCTEIPMLIHQNDFYFPVFDTTKIHSQTVIDFALSK